VPVLMPARQIENDPYKGEADVDDEIVDSTTTVESGISEVVKSSNTSRKNNKHRQESTGKAHHSGPLRTKRAGGETQEIPDPKKPHLALVPIVRTDYTQRVPHMFCSTINSGDFNNLQGFFNTFVSKRGQYLTNHDVPTVFGLPKPGLMCGPLMMVHYFIGWFVMYPDLTVQISKVSATPNNGQRIGSNSKKTAPIGNEHGYTITMELEIRATKVYDIPVGTWLPSAKVMKELYAQNSLQDMIEMLHKMNAVTNTADGSGSRGGGHASTAVPVTVPGAAPAAPAVTPASATTTKGKGKAGAGAGVGAAAPAVPHRGPGRPRLHPLPTPTPAPQEPTVYGAELPMKDSDIPDSFIRVLRSGATLLPVPQRMHSRGKLHLQLDENNHMLSVSNKMVQMSLNK
jgi:hypothetical protein